LEKLQLWEESDAMVDNPGVCWMIVKLTSLFVCLDFCDVNGYGIKEAKLFA